MAPASTRDALLEHGALLFARHGVGAVSARQLHDAAGARNESAVHYHFGGRRGLVQAILAMHLDAVEARRATLVEAIEREGATADLRRLVRALAEPMAADLATPVGRAHLRIVAQLSHPALAYASPFEHASSVMSSGAEAGARVVEWLLAAMPDLPGAICRERLAALRGQLISLVGLRAQLVDDGLGSATPEATQLFVANLVDMAVAGLAAPASVEALDAAAAVGDERRRRS
jgi:AcrR family transcriptional regulator